MISRNCYYYILIAITNVNSATSGFRTFWGKRLSPKRATISFNARSIRNRRESFYSASASTPRKLHNLNLSPNDDGELSRDIPYFAKEKKSWSVDDAVVANFNSNNSLLDDLVYIEEKDILPSPYDGDELRGDKPYLLNEKGAELVETKFGSNDNLLDDIVSKEGNEVFSSLNDSNEFSRDKPYFIKEKETMSIKKTVGEIANSNNSVLDEVIVSMEYKVVKDSDYLTDNYLVWNTTKQVLRKVADVSSYYLSF